MKKFALFAILAIAATAFVGSASLLAQTVIIRDIPASTAAPVIIRDAQPAQTAYTVIIRNSVATADTTQTA